MALSREFMGSSLMERSSFASSSSSRLLLGHNFQQKQFLMSPFVVPFEKNRRQVMRLSRKDVNFNTVAAISEDLVKSSSSTSSSSSSLVSGKAVTFKVRAVVTVRNKIKEDFKETFVKHLDAFTDRIGRNVVLELVSTEIDPKTKAPKKSNEAVLKDWSKKMNVKAERVNYTAEFMVDSDLENQELSQ